MKQVYDAEFFDGKCPYTGKPCYEWECNTCEVEAQESEDLGDYPDTIHNQFDNMTGSMNL